MDKNTLIYKDIFSVIKTKDQAEEFKEQCNVLLAQIYEVDKKPLEAAIDSLFTNQFAVTLKKILNSLQVNQNDGHVLKQCFSEIKKVLDEADVIVVTLGITPTAELLEDIADMVRTSFANDCILLESKVDPHILGGAQIIWQGKYLDYGLDKLVSEWFAKRNLKTDSKSS